MVCEPILQPLAVETARLNASTACGFASRGDLIGG
jgi:hypothetical protein